MSGSGLEHPRGLILTSGGDKVAVRAKRHSTNRSTLRGPGQFLSGDSLEHPHGLILTSDGDESAVGAERQRINPTGGVNDGHLSRQERECFSEGGLILDQRDQTR